MKYTGFTALITGASFGLGEEFARQLAADGAGLVLVARSEDKLNHLAAELRQSANVQVTVVPCDLSRAEDVERLIGEIAGRDLAIDLLVNNAGLGVFEKFLDTPVKRQMDQVDVNIRALVRLTHALAPAMVTRRRGGVINVASTAGFQPLAGADVYAASKAFVLFFSEALSLELEGSGVKVLAVCPGPVATQFFAEMSPKLRPGDMDQPRPVVQQSLRAFEQGKRVVYPGKLSVRLGTWGARFLPRNAVLRIAASAVRDLNRK